MVDIPSIKVKEALDAKTLADKNYLLAKELYEKKDYYCWIVVILFYSACALAISVCNIEGIAVPRQHKGRYDNRKKEYIKGHLDIVEQYFSQKSYSSYSYLLISSQDFRYVPNVILNFERLPDVHNITKKFFTEYNIIRNDYEFRYNKYLKTI